MSSNQGRFFTPISPHDPPDPLRICIPVFFPAQIRRAAGDSRCLTSLLGVCCSLGADAKGSERGRRRPGRGCRRLTSSTSVPCRGFSIPAKGCKESQFEDKSSANGWGCKIYIRGQDNTENGAISAEYSQVEDAGVDLLEFKPSEVAAGVALCLSEKRRSLEADDALSSCVYIDKERALECYGVIRDMALISRPFKSASGSISSVPQSPIGKLDAACLNYGSDGIVTIGSQPNYHSSPKAKRRKIEKARWLQEQGNSFIDGQLVIEKHPTSLKQIPIYSVVVGQDEKLDAALRLLRDTSVIIIWLAYGGWVAAGRPHCSI